MAARAADSKLGVDTVVLEVGGVLAIVDWFVITSAANARQARTMAEEVEEQLRRHDGEGPLRVEGADDARWIVLDYGDIAVHVLSVEAREFYDLERLWGDVPRLDWDGRGRTVGGAHALTERELSEGADSASGTSWSG